MTPKKTVLLFVFNGFADWEAAYVLPEINKSSPYQVVTVSLEQTPVVSMGGLRVLPDITLSQINYQDTALFILPGGTMWEQSPVGELVPVVTKCREHAIPVAAICGATLFLARQGYLDCTPHTSNQLQYLKTFSPNYTGEPYYEEKPCIAGNGLITANGAAALEFGRTILEALGLYDEDELEQWYKLFKYGIIPEIDR